MKEWYPTDELFERNPGLSKVFYNAVIRIKDKSLPNILRKEHGRLLVHEENFHTAIRLGHLKFRKYPLKPESSPSPMSPPALLIAEIESLKEVIAQAHPHKVFVTECPPSPLEDSPQITHSMAQEEWDSYCGDDCLSGTPRTDWKKIAGIALGPLLFAFLIVFLCW